MDAAGETRNVGFRGSRAAAASAETSGGTLRAAGSDTFGGGNEGSEGTVFMFPGQGSQHPGMCRDIYEGSDFVRGYVHRAGKVSGINLERAIFGSTESELAETELAQVAVFTLSTAMADLLISMGIHPWAVVGHSLGEYSALVVSGCLGWEEALRAVILRGRAMSAAGRERPGTMMAVMGMTQGAVDGLTARSGPDACVVAANYNAPKQTVIAGTVEAVEAAGREAMKSGALGAVRLSVGGAFHSPLMQEAERSLEPVVDGLGLKSPKRTLVSSVTGEVVRDIGPYRTALRHQITSPVLWKDALECLGDLGGERFIEVGPGSALKSLARGNGLRSKTKSIDTYAECASLSEELSVA